MTSEIFDVSTENDGFNFDNIMGDGDNSPADIDDTLLSKINAKNQKKMEAEVVKSIVHQPKGCRNKETPRVDFTPCSLR